MNTFRSGLINISYKILINILCHKRNHRCSRLTKRYKCGIKSHVRVNLILSHFLNPETCSRTSYIPVWKLVNKVIKHSCRFCNLVICKVIVNCLNKCIKLWQKPLIHYRKFIVFKSILCCIKLVNIRIQYEERIRVPKCTHKFTLSFRNRTVMEAIRQPWSTVWIEVPANCVRAVLFKCIKRINRIALRLRHLLTVFILNVSQNDYILVRCFIE